jgi:HSP20 family protein
MNSPGFPAINIWANEEGQFISAEMPGFKAEDINIDATADTLTISGTRKIDESGDEPRYHRNERGYGEFTRTVQLPFMIDTENVKASYKNGILAIHLQRAEADKPKKISVKNA